jgi:hypothetical protein
VERWLFMQVGEEMHGNKGSLINQKLSQVAALG